MSAIQEYMILAGIWFAVGTVFGGVVIGSFAMKRADRTTAAHLQAMGVGKSSTANAPARTVPTVRATATYEYEYDRPERTGTSEDTEPIRARLADMDAAG
jgi:hypothetical protein